MTVKELFDFITDLSITEENLDEYLDRAMQISSQRSHHEVSEQEKIDEEVPLTPHFVAHVKNCFSACEFRLETVSLISMNKKVS